MSEALFPRRYPGEIAKEFFHSCAWEEAGDPGGAAYKAAYYLFSELTERMGVDGARLVFAHFAKRPPKKLVRQIADSELLGRYYLMEKPNVQKLAEQLAEENKKLPREKRKGPRGSTRSPTIDKYLRRLIKRNNQRRSQADGRTF
jgi:hypothetical protein